MKDIKTLECYPEVKELVKLALEESAHEIIGGSVYSEDDNKILFIGVACRDRRELLSSRVIQYIKQGIEQLGINKLVINAVTY